VCIGNTFALLEGPLVLATVLQRFRVELVPGQVVVPDPTFTLRPKNGVQVTLVPR
jgi:cytochrome P450